MTPDGPSRFRTRFSLLSLLPLRHPPLVTQPVPQLPAYALASPVSSFHADLGSAYPPTPSPAPSLRPPSPRSLPPSPRSLPPSRGGADDVPAPAAPTKKRDRRPPPLDLSKVDEAYPRPRVVIEPTTPSDDGVERGPAPPKLPLEPTASTSNVTSKGNKPAPKEAKSADIFDNPFEVVEVERGHRYPSFYGLDVKPGDVVPPAASRRVVPVLPADVLARHLLATPLGDSVLHDILLTPTYLRGSPSVHTPDLSPATFLRCVSHRVSQLPHALPPLRGILRHQPRDADDSLRALRDREAAEMDRFRRYERYEHSETARVSPPKRSPGWVGLGEAVVGMWEDKRASKKQAAERKRQIEEDMAKKKQKLWKFAIVFIILALVGLVVGLCVSLISKSSSSTLVATSNSTSAASTLASSVTTSSAAAASTTSATLAACLSQFASTTTPSSFPCANCVSVLGTATNDYLAPDAGNATGVGAALQFCALRDVADAVDGGITGWGDSTSPCGWSGITCDARGRVTAVQLKYPDAPATLPDTLDDIVSLQALHLMGNSSIPTGTFPSSLLSLTNLSTLDIEYTALQGPIASATWSAAAALETLYLVSNAGLGTSVPDLSANTGLVTLAITKQGLTNSSASTLPSSLTYLDLSYNALGGIVPSFAQLTALQTLYLESNAYTAPPAALPASLSTLSLTDNEALQGSMPAAVDTSCPALSPLSPPAMSNKPTTPPGPTTHPALTPNFSAKDYTSFFLAGALCCTLSHGGMTPIDVVKTRIQIDPALKGHSLLSGGRHIVAHEGAKGLLTGFGPTAVGYFFQGGAKFAGYEAAKKKLVELAGSQDVAVKNRTAIYLGGAAIAEFFADILLTPLEATRIRLVSDPKYATGLVSGLTKIASTEGFSSLYAGFIPILLKQVPYAIGQFTVNERATEAIYNALGPERKARLSPTQNFGITLTSGVIAGFAAAVLSHPADTLLSQINKGHGPKGSMVTRLYALGKEAGVRGLFAGLGPRMIMTAGLVSSQFIMYGYIKQAMGARPGIEIHKDEAKAKHIAPRLPPTPDPPTTPPSMPETRSESRVSNYTKFWQKESAKDGEADLANRLDQYTDLVNGYYDGATELYEYGWAQSFHFCRFYKGEGFLQALARHEHYLSSLIGLRKGQRVLDVGCGVGGPAREIARFSGANVVGINNNEFQVGRAREKTAKAGLSDQVSFVKGNFMELAQQFGENSFDAVYAIEATCHAPTFEGIYGEIFRVLKPGGTFGVYEWCMTDAWDASNPEHKKIQHGIELGDGIAEMRTLSDARKALKAVGFEIVHEQDLADVGDEVPWYYPLEGDIWKAQTVWDMLTCFRTSKLGKFITQNAVWGLEKLHFVPKGTYDVGESLIVAADALVAGGRTKLFTPMALWIVRKPEA
ncbi:Delta(24)-sterol C-methyltransferase [Cryptotrichosporon argae]